MKTVDKIIEYFKNNPILGIILLVVVVVLVAVIIWAIVAACKKSARSSNASMIFCIFSCSVVK